MEPVMAGKEVKVFFLLNFVQNGAYEMLLVNVFCIISCCILIGWFVVMGCSTSHIVKIWFLKFLALSEFYCRLFWVSKAQNQPSADESHCANVT